jgi:hypothetical protein
MATRQEFRRAAEEDIPTYILIEKGVNSEFETYKLNRARKDVQYAHVDSVNIFSFIEEILGTIRLTYHTRGDRPCRTLRTPRLIPVLIRGQKPLTPCLLLRDWGCRWKWWKQRKR